MTSLYLSCVCTDSIRSDCISADIYSSHDLAAALGLEAPTATWMHDDDLSTAQRALNGEADAADAIAGRRAMLCRVLMSCGARSRSDADDLVADVLADCFGARHRTRVACADRILEQYRGQCSLDSWLITVCRNRLRDLVSSAGESKVERDATRDLPAFNELPDEPEVLSLVSEALEAAISRVDPLALVFMRLVYLHGVSQREVAIAWQCHESKVCRLLKDGFATLRRETMAGLKKSDAHFSLEWHDLVRLCETAPQLLYGT